MKKLSFAIAFIIVSSVSLHAQSAAKSVYAELAGPGFASINFDTRFMPREDGVGGRIGIGGFSSGGAGIFTVPAEVNYLLGKDNKNYFELGAGITYVHENGADIFSDDDITSSTTFGHLTLGYRLQPAKGGFLFRAAIVPVFGKGYFIPYYFGIAFGYKF